MAVENPTATRVLVRTMARAVRGLIVRTGADGILANFTPGAPLGSWRARFTPDHLCYPSPTIRTIYRNSVRFDLDISDYMQWCAYYGIEVEPRSALYGLVRPGQVVFDVGANVGEVLLNFARLVSATGHVYGFEINPATYQRCLHNISINAFKNVELFGVGLGFSDGALRLGSPNTRNSGQDRIVSDEGQTGIEVRVTTMDGFVQAQGISRLDLVKIDVEGFEMNVLRGAECTLRKFRPLLFIELVDAHLREQDSSAQELVEFLERLGYRVGRADDNRPVKSTDSFAGQLFDIVARP